MSGVELVCINIGESAAPGAKKFFKKHALCALRALLKARTDSVQLWAAGRFLEIISAPNSHLTHPFVVFRGLAGCP